MEMSINQSKKSIITPGELLEYWQGHRRVTRRVIEAFSEEQLFNYSIGGMRTFAALAMEMLGMAGPGMQGVLTGTWQTAWHHSGARSPKTKQELLDLWDMVTTDIDRIWRQVPEERFLEVEAVFGQWEGPIYGSILYWIENEVHHRGQGYVYLRSLGIAPPPFWERG